WGLKKPKFKAGKNIAVPSETSSYAQFDYPIFCLKHLHKGEFGIGGCTETELAAFVKRMHTLSQMTWQQISNAPRHGLGWEKIGQDAIKTGKPQHITPDTNFLVFRFLGLAPFVGYRNMAVLHILYIDAKFTLYNH
ncbi:MAG: hypothetical protein ACRCYO_08185, partial [Bacteroidia bacterium]